MKQLILFLLSIICINSQAQIYSAKMNWVKAIGISHHAIVMDMVVSTNGDIHICGEFTGKVDFDPGNGVFELQSLGSKDAFILKLDSIGNFLWAVSYGRNGANDRAQKISIDSKGNVYASGTFGGRVDFDPGVGSFFMTPLFGTINDYILKLNKKGAFVWAKYNASKIPIGAGKIYALRNDSEDNIYLISTFRDSTDFDPGPNKYVLNNPKTWNELYIQKLDSNGAFSWVQRIPAKQSVNVSGLVFDTQDNLYMTASYSDSADFGMAGPSKVLRTNRSLSLVLFKANKHGSLLWTKQLNSRKSVFSNELVYDGHDQIYFVGRYSSFTDFKFGPDSLDLKTQYNETGVFIEKIDTIGNLKWVRKFETPSGAFVDIRDFVLDENQDLYLAGVYKDSMRLLLGNDTLTASNSGLEDGFFYIGLDSSGANLWLKTIDGTGNDRGVVVQNISGKGVIGAGTIMESVDVDPGALQKIITSALNVESSIIQHMEHCLADTASLQVTPCDEFKMPGTTKTYLKSGIYKNTLVNMNGCDSLMTYEVTLRYSSTNSINDSACNVFTSASGKQYSQSGNYIEYLTNSVGCDSVLNLNIVINSIDTSVQKTNDSTLVSNQPIGVFQWLNCDSNNSFIVGATRSTFSSKQRGNYAVMIQNGKCLDTSNCHNINILTNSIFRSGQTGEMGIFPNPTSGLINVSVLHQISVQKVIITDVTGKVVYECLGYKPQIDISSLPSGTYVLSVFNPKEQVQFKIMKE